MSIKSDYLKAQAKADTLALEIMYNLDCVEAFRCREEDNFANLCELKDISEKLERLLGQVKSYHDKRVRE